jgi:hypothetical protein
LAPPLIRLLSWQSNTHFEWGGGRAFLNIYYWLSRANLSVSVGVSRRRNDEAYHERGWPYPLSTHRAGAR